MPFFLVLPRLSLSVAVAVSLAASADQKPKIPLRASSAAEGHLARDTWEEEETQGTGTGAGVAGCCTSQIKSTAKSTILDSAQISVQSSPVQSSLPPLAAHSHWDCFHGFDITDSRISGSRSNPNSVEIQLRPAASIRQTTRPRG